MTDKLCALCADLPAVKTVEGYDLCDSCADKVQAYADRLEARIERLQKSADKETGEYERRYNTAHTMASHIPFGQPILVGHHSEKRDRNYRAKIENNFRKAFEHLDRAAAKQRRVTAAMDNRAIASDDPLAIPKLRARIERAENVQAFMKEVNKTVRANAKLPEAEQVSALVVMGIHEVRAAEMVKGDFLKRKGFPDYRLTNNSGNIRRMKERLAGLEKQQARAKAVETAQAAPEKTPEMAATLSNLREMHGDVELVRDYDDNRLRLIFPGKPDTSTIALLKKWGFRWSPSNRAWQRHLNASGEWAAEGVLTAIGKWQPRTPVVPVGGDERTEPEIVVESTSVEPSAAREKVNQAQPSGLSLSLPALEPEFALMADRFRDELEYVPELHELTGDNLWWLGRVLAVQFTQDKVRPVAVLQTEVGYLLKYRRIDPDEPTTFNTTGLMHMDSRGLRVGAVRQSSIISLFGESDIEALTQRVAGKLPNDPVKAAEPPKQLPLFGES